MYLRRLSINVKKNSLTKKVKTFYTLIDFDKVKDKNFFDLSLSLDVIYHLVEDRVFDLHMKTLFYSSKYVIIFSTISMITFTQNNMSKTENLQIGLIKISQTMI